MSIVGSSFTKMDVVRAKALKGKVNINNNIGIIDISSEGLALGGANEKGLKFTFDFTCVYEPDIGHIKLTGELLVIEKAELTKEIIDSWNDKKQIRKDYMTNILNAVLTKCNVQALILSQTMNLPPPIPMPKVSADAQEVQEKPAAKPAKPAKK